MLYRGHKIKNVANDFGYALPTVLIASIIMLMVLLAAVTSTVATRSALSDQYYNKLAATAAEAGVEYAKACIIKNGSATWTTANKLLTPGLKCDGITFVGLVSTCEKNQDCYVVYVDEKIRTKFEVSFPTTIGTTYVIKSKGTTELLRKSGTVWRPFVQNVTSRFVYTP